MKITFCDRLALIDRILKPRDIPSFSRRQLDFILPVVSDSSESEAEDTFAIVVVETSGAD